MTPLIYYHRKERKIHCTNRLITLKMKLIKTDMIKQVHYFYLSFSFMVIQSQNWMYKKKNICCSCFSTSEESSDGRCRVKHEIYTKYKLITNY